MLSLKDAVTLFFTSPVVALLLDWLLLGHAPGCRGAAATVLTLLGATCVTQPPFIFKHLPFFPMGGGGSSDRHGGVAAGALAAAATADLPFFVALRQAGRSQAQLLAQAMPAVPAGLGGPALGAIMALAAAVANASGFVAAGLLRGHQHPAVLTWWYNGVLALVTGAPLAAAVPLPIVWPSHRAAALLCGVGATQLVAQLCLNRGFQLESAGRGAAINVLQVLFSFILDVAVLHTRPSLLSVLGSALVAAGVLSVALAGKGGAAPLPSAGAKAPARATAAALQTALMPPAQTTAPMATAARKRTQPWLLGWACRG
ncbi:hypothetical protein HXX76_010220 [Chlamydomonas incerta]|uniref:EamA domain-containing protein n=1 Tax=Chlamydomonas incerta TaxID=51695 RepID=A0A835VYX5_CHLIN|nr:hypothetical protein HXX76_010220 [Chlamydomonas incerta]|eukprot:KAG2430121.1 hypothetical protein HXX76_010220 [Chlamydomonas incerta]